MATRRLERTARSTLAVLMALLMVTSVMAPAVAYSLPANDGTAALDPGVETNTNGTGDSVDDDTKTTEPAVVSSNVRELVATARAGEDDSSLVSQSSGETRITVTVEAVSGQASAAADAVAAYGDITNRFGGKIEASLPPGAIEAVADASAVSAIRRPDPVVRADRGVDVSEGLSNINSTSGRLGAGVNGSGVTVAVVDTGFDVGNDEIDDHVVEATDFEDDGIDNETGLHGTAVSELVVDTAPNVSLLLYEVETGTQIGSAIRDIDRNTSADVATMSLGLLTGPFNGTSAIDEAIADSVGNGTSWYVSAGNYADGNHYNQTWRDGDSDGRMNVSETGETIDVSADGPFSVYVNWNEPGSDYDVYLNASGSEVDNSSNDQSTFDPTEVVRADEGGEYTLRIENESASGTADFDIFVDGATITPNTSARSVVRPATEETVVALGAVYYGNNGLEGFSSRGPTIDGRTKPDLVAPDGVQTSGLNPFYGTSAAAPHAAGVAALVLDGVNKSIGPAQLEGSLTASATRLDAAVPNDLTGYGLVNATGALDAARTLAASDGADPVAVSTCRVIDEPGTYEITEDLFAQGGECIEIDSSNVTLYGNGHEIENTFGNTADYEVGIDVGLGVSNVTIANVTIRYFENGIELSDVHDSTVRDVFTQPDQFDSYALTDIQGNSISVTQSAIRIDDGSSNVTVRDSELNSAGDRLGISNAVYVRDSNNVTVRDNTIFDAGQNGISLSNTSDSTVENNEIRGLGFSRLMVSGIAVSSGVSGSDNVIRDNEVNGESRLTDFVDDAGVLDGIYVGAPNTTVVGNDVHNNYQRGIVVELGGDNTTVRDNHVYQNWGGNAADTSGVVVGQFARNVTLTANRISGNNNADGVLIAANDTTVTDNRILFNDMAGLRLEGIVTISAVNNTLQDNRGVELSMADTGSLTLTDLHLATSGTDPPANVTLTGSNVELSAVSRFDVPAEPAGVDDIGHFVNVTNTSNPSISSFELKYGDADASTVDESNISMYRHNGSAWVELSGTNTIDPATNTITADVPTSGLIAPFGPDVVAPTINSLTLRNDSGNLSITAAISERLGELEVTVENSSGTVRTLTKSNFTERSSADSARYSTELTTLALGTYNVTIEKATDDAGNPAPAGQNESILLTVPLSISSASISDATDSDGTILDGDEVSVSVTPNGENIQSVVVDASSFGGSSNLALSDRDGDGTYTETFTVDVRPDTFGYSADVTATVTDAQGNSASTGTNYLTVETAITVDNSTASDATDGNGIVTDGDVVTVSADVSGTSNISSVVANASAFGAGSSVPMSDNDDDGVYNGSFTVDGSNVTSDGLFTIDIIGTDEGGRSSSEVTSLIRVDTSPPSVGKFRGTGWLNPGVRNAADNGSRVQPGDTIEFKVYASDFGTDIDRVVAYPTDFGIDSVTLTESGAYYTGSAVVDGANASADGNYDIRIEAVDGVGLSANTTASLYMNNTGDDEPPFLDSASATNLNGLNTDVRDGHRIEVSVTASDSDPGIDTIYANASAFGVDRVPLTQASGDIYNATFVVDVANVSVSSDGEYDIEIVATDGFGNTADTTTNTLTLNAGLGPDTTAPFIVSAYTSTPQTALFAVNDGTVVEAIANVDETGSGVASVTINATPLGAGVVSLTDANNDSEYNATFVVDAAQAASDGTYSLTVNATDNAGNSGTRTTTDTITLDTTPPDVSNVTATNLNGTNDDLRDGDEVRVTADVSDLTRPSVEVDVPVLGDGTFGPIILSDRDEDGTYETTLTVDADDPSIASNGSTVQVGITATDEAANTATGTSNPLVLNYSTGTTDTTAPIVGISTLTDLTDGNGVVTGGDTVRVSVDASDADSGIDTVTADVSDFGGSATLSLSDGDDDGTYDATFTVDESSASADKGHRAFVTVTDNAGNQAFGETISLTLDTTAPSVENVTATNTDGANDDVRDGDVVRITANVSDATAVTVTGRAGQFGVSEDIVMEDDDGDGIYEGTFTVNASSPAIEANGSTVSASASATDEAGNAASALSNGLTLNYSTVDTAPPTLGNATAIDRTDGDGVVRDGDLIEVRVNATDPNGITRLEATVLDFTGATTVDLTNAGGDLYNATFRVDAANASSEGNHSIAICAEDSLGNAGCEPTNELTLTYSTGTNDTTAPTITNATAIDLTDRDGIVTNGDLVELRAFVTDNDSGVRRVFAYPEVFGSGEVVLTEESGDLYNATFVVGSDFPTINGSYQITLSAEDEAGNFAGRSTNPLTINVSEEEPINDTTAPTITDMRAIDRTDGDGVVSGGDLVEVRAFVSDLDSGVQDVLAFPEPFGVEQVGLTRESGDLYNTTFVVNANDTFPDDVYPITITATDGANNVANATTDLLELNTTGDGETNDTTPPGITDVQAVDRTDGDGTVSDGDLVEVRAFVSDFDSGVREVLAFPEPFGVEQVVLSNENGDLYNTTFVVNGSDTFPDDIYQIPLIAVDGAGNVANVTTGFLELNTTGDGETADTTAPTITDMRAIDRTDGDGVVSGGDRIEVRAFVSDFDSGVQDVLAFPEPFGVEQVVLSNENGDLYNATFVVNANDTFPDDIYRTPIIAVDGANNSANATTNFLELNTTGNTTERNPLRLTNATAIDREDGDGTVSDGDLVEVRVLITGADGGINRTGAIADPFGVQIVNLTHVGGDAYNGTFQVDGSAAFQSDGDYRIAVRAEDNAGNFNSTFTNTLRLNASEGTGDTTPPSIRNATATNLDGPNDDVRSGDRVEVRVNVTDPESGINRIGAFADAFGVDPLPLTPVSASVYNATFVVDGDRAAPIGSYAIGVRVEDNAGNVANASTNPLQLNTTDSDGGDGGSPTVESATATNLDGPNNDVRGGDRIRVTANVSGDVGAVFAPAFEFGVRDEVRLFDNDTNGIYVGEFTVNASSSLIAPSGATIPLNVTAVSSTDAVSAMLTNALTLNYTDAGGAEPSTGLLEGTVTDETGAPVSGIELAVVNATTGATASVSTDSQGSYDVELPTGTYAIVVDQPGYEPTELRGIDISENTTTVRDITLNESAMGADVGIVTSRDVTGTPGENVTVQFNVTNTGDTERGYILQLGTLPAELTVVSQSADGGVWNGNDSWLYQTIQPGESVAPSVTLAISENASDERSFVAELLANDSIVDGTTVNVSTTVSIEAAVDDNGDGRIGNFEILDAIELWRNGEAVSGTGGKTIGNFKILDLIEQWRKGSQIGSQAN